MAARRIDWPAIRHRYVTGGASLRDLAAEYGISLTALRDHCKSEDWVGERNTLRHRRATAATQRATDAQVREDTRIYDITSRLLDKIADAVESIDPVEERQSLRALTGALRDLREIRGEKSKLDLEEQKARIAKLRHDVEEQHGGHVVEIVGMPEGFDV